MHAACCDSEHGHREKCISKGTDLSTSLLSNSNFAPDYLDLIKRNPYNTTESVVISSRSRYPTGPLFHFNRTSNTLVDSYTGDFFLNSSMCEFPFLPNLRRSVRVHNISTVRVNMPRSKPEMVVAVVVLLILFSRSRGIAESAFEGQLRSGHRSLVRAVRYHTRLMRRCSHRCHFSECKGRAHLSLAASTYFVSKCVAICSNHVARACCAYQSKMSMISMTNTHESCIEYEGMNHAYQACTELLSLTLSHS